MPYLSARQLQEWRTFEAQVGLYDRDDIFYAMALSLTANIHRGQDGEPSSPKDFLVYGQPDEGYQEELTLEDLKRRIGTALKR